MFKKLKKLKYVNYFPFLILFFIMLILHINTRIFNDDLNLFGKVLKDGGNLFNWLGLRWKIWTSRILLEFLEVIFDTLNINVWRIVDSLVYTLMAFSISKIFSDKNDIKNNSIICLLILLIPFTFMYSAGWVSTTIVYIWTFTFGLFAFIPIMNSIRDKKTSIIYYILSYIFLLVAINQEQMCCLVFGFSSISIFILWKNKKSFKYPLSILTLSILSFLIISICPGNSLRVIAETSTWYPEYALFGIKEKIYLSIVPTINSIFVNKYIISVLLFSITYSFFQNKYDNKYKLISLIMTIITLLLTIFSSITINTFDGIKLFLSIFTYEYIPNTGSNISDLYMILPLIFSIIYIIMLVYLVYILFKDKKNYLFYPIFILAAFASRAIMGFSPTVFASGYRTSFYMFAMFIILNYIIIKNLKIKKESIIIPIVVIIVTAILNCINLINELVYIGA